MTARVLDGASANAIAEAARRLHEGGLVAFPTETVYGLGAIATDEAAVARIFAAKARPSFDPLIVHLAGAARLAQVADGGDPRVARLAARFWPGPLTLVLPRRQLIPDIVTSGLDTVAVRVPSHPVAQALLDATDAPVAAPSANPFGYVSPTTAAHVCAQLADRVDLVLDGGPCRVGVESTVLSLVGPPRLLRPGGVPREELEAALGEPIETAPAGAAPAAPGQLDRHYATRTPLVVLTGPATAAPAAGRTGLLAYSGPPPAGFAAVEVLAPDGSLSTAAAALFAALRRLDALGLDGIQAEPCPEAGLGHAIMDRLRRAAARS